MSLFDSLVNLVAETGFSPDTILWIFGFGMAVYWIISIAMLGVFVAFWLKVLRLFFQWLSGFRKK